MPTLTVGLTGGIGSGKSEVAHRLAARGAVVIDADLIAREVVAPGTDGLAAVLAAFGPVVAAADGSLDRQRLARVVFSDATQRSRLNAIVHPLVRAETARRVAAAPADAVVVNDVPLLVETGLAPSYHLVVVVEAPEAVRLARLTGSRGLSAADAGRRMASQAGSAARAAAADVVIDNDGPRRALHASVDRLWTSRLLPYAENIRAGRLARPERAVLVPADPSWAAAYRRVAARLRTVAGVKALRVDHVGSTAVPGLAAKDVLDVALTVATIADADDLRGALRRAGFPNRPDITADRPKPVDPEPAHWTKRFHGSADPGRPVNLHLRPAGSAGARYALLFRDWLRAVPAERSAYETVKRGLAAGAPPMEVYTDAKEPWFDAALSRAQDWAAATGWRLPEAPDPAQR